jgi:hypothetical protein
MVHITSLFSLAAVANIVFGAEWIGEVKKQDNVTYQCKCYSDNACWPTTTEWSALNSTVGGALQVALPPGAVCHNKVANLSVSTYNAAACENVKANWLNEQFLYVLASIYRFS